MQVGEQSPKSTKLPLLTDVPIYFPRANGYCITLPIAKGDECLIVFADMCIDGWWQSGGMQDQMETRRHDLSDAFAFVGVTSQPRKVSGYSDSKLHIRTDDQSVVIEIDKDAKSINMTASGNVRINAGGSVTIQGAAVYIN